MRKLVIASPVVALLFAIPAAAQPVYGRVPTTTNSAGQIVQSDPVASMDKFTSGTLNAATLGAVYPVMLGDGRATVSITMAGLTASGATLTSEYSDDIGQTWRTIRSISTAVAAGTSTFTADDAITINGAGHTYLRLRVSTAGTGTISITSNASTAAKGVTLEGTQPPPLGVTTTAVSFTGGAASTYTSALAASPSRRGCTIFSTTAFSVSPGASSTVATAIPAGATQGGYLFSCTNPVGFVMQDQINVASSTASASYVVWSQ